MGYKNKAKQSEYNKKYYRAHRESELKRCTAYNKEYSKTQMGSGTVALSAIKYGCDYIGFEKFQEYIDMANNRINKND